ncbi:Hypothetical predicted protein [Cloeon dipterum]|uniref:UBA domain-containing protein n=1 Tax=Cloeon dipterum TaxID=197152 RepID=A0A8S1C130_9INSE|nr:Hypothetical predicted protein [Cloeon dipterum]
MFPNESSSDEISAESSDAFVQIRKEPAEHRGVFGGVMATTSFDSQRPLCPVDQVPVSRDSTRDHTLSGAISVISATGNISSTSDDEAEQESSRRASVALNTTHVVYSKEQARPEVAMTEEAVTQERATRIMMHTVAAAKAAGPCDPKSEAGPRVVTVVRASAKLSASVIFPSSRCGAAVTPSLQHKGSDRTGQQAQPSASGAGPLGSSSSTRLQHCAQSHTPLNTQANSDPKTSQVPLTTPHSPCNKDLTMMKYPATANLKNVIEQQLWPKQGAAFKDMLSAVKSSNLNVIIPKNRLYGPASNADWGIPRGCGLLGGGESSLNNGTSGWGTPPASSANSAGWGQNTSSAPNAQTAAQGSAQWGAATRPVQPAGPSGQPNKGSQSPQQQQPVQQPIQPSSASGGQQQNQQQQPPSQQATQAGNGTGQPAQPSNGSPSWAQAAGGAGGGPGKGPGQPPGSNGGPGATGTTSSKQLEQINSMREALLSQDGWGGQHVNQDTGWDIPNSPEPGMKEGGGWKPNVNNGTDLWEANLRNGGQPTQQPAAKTPWGHTPSTNIGGTWGEDDDVGDNANMWQGVPNTGGGGGGGGSGGPSGPQWGAGPTAIPKKESDWGPGGSTWGDARDMRAMGMDPRAAATAERDLRGSMGMDMGGRGDMMRPDMMMNPRDPRLGGGAGGGGRMNGEGPMWGAPKGQQPPVNQWGGPPNKEMKTPSGWEEPSPPAQRRQIQNYDDGTSLWGNPGNPQAPTWRGGPTKADGGKVSHWKDIPHPSMGGRSSGMQCPPGMAQGRGMPSGGGMKPDVAMWGHPQRNGSWDGPQGPHDGPSGWGDDSAAAKMGGWNEPNMMAQGSWGGPKPKMGWGDTSDVDPSSWGHPKPGPKPLTKDMIWASKQFRLMTEMNIGYKKDDIENALRSTNMNMEDAIELLNSMRDGFRRSDEHPFDLGGSGGPHPGGPGGGGYPGRVGYNPPQQMPFAPPGPGVNNAPSLMNNANNPSLPSINTMSPAIVQKILTQQPPPAAAAQPSTQQPFQSVQRTPLSQPQPSAAQLRMLVQQIQTAVQSGHLNPQILNQPLAPQTLQLLNQLLNQIKLQHSLVQQQTLISLQPLTKQQNQNHLQISVQITKTKQTIANLQNQIAAQQALFVKQQSNMSSGQQADYFPKPPMPDPTMSLDVSLGHLSIKEPQSQSRLNQWIKQDKDNDGSINEFDRAPGNSKSQSHTSPNMNPLLGQADSTWSSVGRGAGDSGWPDSSAELGGGAQNDNTNSFEVPEFEPGKPWKGSNLKNIEDDPTLTPGSVMPSPLSVPTIKDSVFSTNKTSPPSSIVSSAADTMSSVGLSNPTWSYNSASSGSAFASLSNNGSGPRATGGTSSWSTGGWGGSTWLLLRNLTPQIDGSTLKTLCLQHGPLLNFHLYLNHGLAMAKYQTREEAAKAQGALNNCVLSNTTIFAESPADSEVHSLMSQLHSSGSQGPSSGAGWGNLRPGSGPASGQSGSAASAGGQQGGQQPNKPPPDAWGGGGGSSSQLWSAPTSASSLWGAAPLDAGDQHRATPSSLNSFLPGDLLGEGM